MDSKHVYLKICCSLEFILQVEPGFQSVWFIFSGHFCQFPPRRPGGFVEEGLKSSRFYAVEIGASLSFSPQINFIFSHYHNSNCTEDVLRRVFSRWRWETRVETRHFRAFFVWNRGNNQPPSFLAAATALAPRTWLPSFTLYYHGYISSTSLTWSCGYQGLCWWCSSFC